jgi:cell division protein ZapA
VGDITITVNKRTYDVRCDDGHEGDVVALAGDVDRRVTALARTVGQAGEARLLLLAALIMADEIKNAVARTSVKPAGPGGDGDGANDDANRDAGAVNRLSAEIEALAARIESIAARLAAS